MVNDGSWEFNPIPAFDLQDRLIPPGQYAETLKGAIVHVKINITHQYIHHDNKADNYYADLEELTVLAVPATSVPPTETARKMQNAFALLKGVPLGQEEGNGAGSSKRKATSAQEKANTKVRRTR